MQIGEVAANMILCRFAERNIQFSLVVSDINQFFKIPGRVSITDYEDKYFRKS